MRVQCEVGSQQAACVSMVVMVHFIHVVWRVPNLHVYPSVRHGLSLDTLSPERCVWSHSSLTWYTTCRSTHYTLHYWAHWEEIGLLGGPKSWDARNLWEFCRICWNKQTNFSLINQLRALIFKVFLYLSVSTWLLTFAAVCRCKLLPPPSRSGWPAGPEAQWWLCSLQSRGETHWSEKESFTCSFYNNVI